MLGISSYLHHARRGLCILLAGLLLLPSLVSAAPSPAMERFTAAPSRSDQDNLPDDRLSLEAEASYDGVYRIGSWTPVQITVQNDGADTSATIQVRVNQSSTAFASLIDLPGGARKTVTVYVFITSFTHRLTVDLMRDDASIVQQSITVEPHPASDYMVAGLSGAEQRLLFPDELRNNTQLAYVPVELSQLPDRAAGLNMFDAIVLHDVPTLELSDNQRSALHEWVARGGQLIISGGTGANRTVAGLPNALQIIRVHGTRQEPAADLFSTSVNSQAMLAIAQYEVISSAESLQPYALSNPALNQPAEQALLIEQTIGNGAVTFFAASLAEATLSGLRDTQSFWSDILRPRQPLAAGFAPTDLTLDAFNESNVASALVNIPALELPSLLTLSVLLLLYIVLVGPVTYVTLRSLDRQALGWIVVPALTVLFAVGTYAIGYAQRGGDVVLNQITLVEQLDSGNDPTTLSRVRSFIGVLSPKPSSYLLNLDNTRDTSALTRPISLQGPWDINTNQGGVFTQETLASGSAQVSNLDIAQWSMRAILADEIQSYRAVDAQVVLDDQSISGEVVNTSGQMLYDVTLIQGNRIARLGDMAPGEHRNADLVREDATSFGGPFGEIMPLGYMIYHEAVDRANQPDGTPLSPELQFRTRLLDVLYPPYGPALRAAQPLLLAWQQQPLLDVSIPDQRIDHQHHTLIIAQPRLQAANERIVLERGWLEQFNAQANQVCSSSQGIGVQLFDQPVESMLRLPRDLLGLQPDDLTLFATAEGPWPGAISIELFDWTTGEWVWQPVEGEPLPIKRPGRFLSSDGKIRIRIDSQANAQMSTGCIYIDASLQGTQF